MRRHVRAISNPTGRRMVLTCFILPSFINCSKTEQASHWPCRSGCLKMYWLKMPKAVAKRRGPCGSTWAPFSTRKTHHFWTRKPADFRTRKLARFGTRIWHGFSAFLLPFPFSWFSGFLPPVFLVSWFPRFPGLLRLFPGFILSWLFGFPVSRSPGFVGFACLLVFWSLSFLLI